MAAWKRRRQKCGSHLKIVRVGAELDGCEGGVAGLGAAEFQAGLPVPPQDLLQPTLPLPREGRRKGWQNSGLRMVLHGREDVVPGQTEELRVAQAVHVGRPPASPSSSPSPASPAPVQPGSHRLMPSSKLSMPISPKKSPEHRVRITEPSSLNTMALGTRRKGREGRRRTQ